MPKILEVTDLSITVPNNQPHPWITYKRKSKTKTKHQLCSCPLKSGELKRTNALFPHKQYLNLQGKMPIALKPRVIITKNKTENI
jgi:hypothetical protein